MLIIHHSLPFHSTPTKQNEKLLINDDYDNNDTEDSSIMKE